MANIKSYKDYLRFLYGDEFCDLIWVVQVDVPIDPPPPRKVDWYGQGLSGDVDFATFTPLKAHYHSTSALKPKAVGRVLAEFAAMPIVMLDDLSFRQETKFDVNTVKAALGVPRVLLKSSNGNYQGSYRLRTPIRDPLRAAKFQQGLAVAGLTDGGGQNPVRLQRLPGGVNGKSSKMLDKVELAEANDNDTIIEDDVVEKYVRLYEDALAQGKVAGVSAAQGTCSADLDKPDVYLRALDLLGWVKGQSKTRKGVVDIRCPWEHEHTTAGTPTGYLGSGRFHCFHRCSTKTDREFRTEIARQVGEPLGLTADEIMNGWTLEALGAARPEDVEEILSGEDGVYSVPAEKVDPSAGFVTWDKDILSRVVYVRAQDRFLERVTKSLWTPKGFKVAARKVVSTGEGSKKNAETMFHDQGGRVVEDITYWPGQKEFVTHPRSKLILANLYEGRTGFALRGVVMEKDIEPWLRRMRINFPDPDVLECILDIMSLTLQHPEVKINWIWLTIGPQGVGKDLTLLPLKWGVGEGNHADVTMTDLEGQFNAHWLPRKLIVLQELSLFGRKAIYERLKTIAAAPPEWHGVNGKFQPVWEIPNLATVVSFSNHPGAVDIPWDDRRFWPTVIDDRAKGLPDEYADLAKFLFGGPTRDEGLRLVASWLRWRTVKAGLFDPKTCPPDTRGHKAQVAYQASSDQAQWIADTIENMRDDGVRTVVASAELAAMWSRRPRNLTGGKPLTSTAINEAMKAMGCERLTEHAQRLVGEHRSRLWSVGRGSAGLPSDPGLLRALWEKEGGPRMLEG